MPAIYAVNASLVDEVSTSTPLFHGKNMVIGRTLAIEERISAYITLAIFNADSGFNFFGSITPVVEGNLPEANQMVGSFNPRGTTFLRVAMLDPGMVNDLFDEFDGSFSDTTFDGLSWNPFALMGASFLNKPPSENATIRAINQVIVRRATYSFDYVLKEFGDDPPENRGGPFSFDDLGDPDFVPPENTAYSATGTELLFDDTIEMLGSFSFDGVHLIEVDVAPTGSLAVGTYEGHSETVVDIYGVYNPNLE